MKQIYTCDKCELKDLVKLKLNNDKLNKPANIIGKMHCLKEV